MQLGANQAAMFMGCGCQPAVVSGPFAGKKRMEAPFSHGNIPYDDHGTAAGGNGFHFCKKFILFQPHGGRGEDDPVFQGQPAQCDRAVYGFIHGGSFLSPGRILRSRASSCVCSF